MRILILNGCWSPNIGNAFVNIGTEVIVRSIFGDCDIIYSADVANKWFFGVPTESGKYVINSFNISKYMDVDLVVWGGMILTRYNFELAEPIFMEFNKKEIPILFIGAGADEYTKEEADYVAGILEKIKYIGIITRDDKTYDLFSQFDFLQWKIVKGIDAAFFVSEYKIPELNLEPYDVECFDRINVPYIEHNNKRVITTHHDCFGRLPLRYIYNEDTLISELPYDYLTLYKNVDITYTERVHACIVTLAYGHRARLYSDTIRASLFDRVIENGSERITNDIVSVDMERLKREKQKVLRNVKTFYQAFKKQKEYYTRDVELLQVYIETISACNRKCPYCYFTDDSDKTSNGKKMSKETFNWIVENLEEINYSNIIYLYDINEPLLDNRLPYFIHELSSRLPMARIYIFSNGDLATEENVGEYFRNGLTHFVFSLHDHSNDQKIKKIIKRYGAEKFTIADMTILSTEEFMNRGGSIKNEKIVSQQRWEQNSCWLPFRQILVNPDGNFRLCCSIRDEVLLGNIYQDNLINYFYHNNELKRYRDNLAVGKRKELFPCRDCSFKGDNEEGIKAKLGVNYQLRQAIYTVNKEGLV